MRITRVVGNRERDILRNIEMTILNPCRILRYCLRVCTVCVHAVLLVVVRYQYLGSRDEGSLVARRWRWLALAPAMADGGLGLGGAVQ